MQIHGEIERFPSVSHSWIKNAMEMEKYLQNSIRFNIDWYIFSR